MIRDEKRQQTGNKILTSQVKNSYIFGAHTDQDICINYVCWYCDRVFVLVSYIHVCVCVCVLCVSELCLGLPILGFVSQTHIILYLCLKKHPDSLLGPPTETHCQSHRRTGLYQKVIHTSLHLSYLFD